LRSGAELRAAIFKGVRAGVSVEEVPDPRPGTNGVLIGVRDCGICGSDLAILEGRHNSKPPVILGHELSGEVKEVADGVKGLKVGDHVVVDPNVNCGICGECRSGRRNMCLDLVEIGITSDGGFAELMSAPEMACHAVDPGLSWKEGALVEPLACVVHGFERSRARPDESAVVYGAGPMGLLWVLLLKRAGLRMVVSVDPAKTRREAAMGLGADVTVDPSTQEAVAEVERLTGGRGADIAVEMVGRTETFENAVRSVGTGGRVVVMGVARRETRGLVSQFDVMSREVTIVGSNASSFEFPSAIRLIQDRVVPADDIVSHELGIDEIQRGFDLCRAGEAMKVMIKVG
jgi:L-iditol 2-dehydrogenase